MRRTLATLFLVAAALDAQYGRGTILGTVTDSTGAVLPGLKVTVKNLGTNETREFTTDDAGNYQFSALFSGRYDVTASGGQFKTAALSNVELRVNSQVRADIVMQLGVVSETVSVTSAVPQ
jgi:protocatechuate 3,4-dioxygenase beta subunit